MFLMQTPMRMLHKTSEWSYRTPFRGGYKDNEDVSVSESNMKKEKPLYPEGCDFEKIVHLCKETIQNLKARGYEQLWPSQANTFEAIYNKNNVIARDLTGTGKTLGFCLPLVERMRKEKQFKKGNTLALMLAPTRELALQIAAELDKLKNTSSEFRVVSVYGGQSITN